MPPTSTAWPPRCSIAASAALASAWYRTTVTSSEGSARSIPWWGTSARSAAEGLAVPMSMPRYTCIESTETSSVARVAAGQGEGQGRLPRRRRPDDGDGRQTATTGMRLRWAGSATTSTSRPARWCGAASVTSAVT